MPERAVVTLDDPVLDRASDREGHQRLREHPDDPEDDAGDERRHLVTAHRDQQPNGRARVRDAGVGDGELDHAAARVVVGMRRSGTASASRS